MALRDEPWRRDVTCYPFRAVLQTRYGDQDTNAHLNNVAIARLFEEARLRFHRAMGKVGGLSPGGVMIAHIAIDYLAEGSYPGDVEAGVGVADIGNRSYRLAIALLQAEAPIALAECVMVRRGQPVGEALRAALGRHRIRT